MSIRFQDCRLTSPLPKTRCSEVDSGSNRHPWMRGVSGACPPPPPRGIGDFQGGLKGHLMVHTRFASLARAMVIAAVTCAAVQMLHSPKATATSTASSDTKQPVTDWRERDPMDVFLQVYLALGHDPAEAIARAEDEMIRLGLLEVKDQPAACRIDWEASDLHAMIYDALIDDGFDARSTLPFANLAFENVTGISLAGMEDCDAYQLRIRWCDEENNWHEIVRYTQNGCVETYRAEFASCPNPIPMCLGQEQPWFEMHKAAGCGESRPPTGTCVWMRWATSTIKVWCATDFYPCECFEEVDELDCDVDIECADPHDGPDECPCS